MQAVGRLYATFKAKLILSFILIVVIFTGVALYNLTQVTGIKTQIANQNAAMDKKVEALELKQNIQVLFNISTNLTSTQNLDLEQEYRDNTASFQKSVTQLAAYADNAEQRKLVPKLKTVSQEFITNFDAAVALLKDENADPLTVIDEMNAATDRTKAHREYLFQLVDSFYQSFSESAMSAINKSDHMLNSTVQASAVASAVVLVLCALVATLLILSFVRPIGQLQQAVKRVAGGDFRYKVHSGRQDELGMLSRDFDHMIDQVNEMTGATKQIASSLSRYSDTFHSFSKTTAVANKEIIRAIDDISSGADQQAIHTEESTNLIAELESGVQEISLYTESMKEMSLEANRNTQTGSASVTSLKKAAEESDQVLTAVFESMEAVMSSSGQIEKIVNTITDISNQTNILSLNAAIEAARAGVHGKGFAVIADEVRQLSGQTKNSSALISQIIRGLVERLSELQMQMQQAMTSFQAQGGKVNETLLSFRSIDSSMDKLTTQMERIQLKVLETKTKNEKLTASVRYVASIAEETAAGVEEVNSTSIQQDEAIRSIADQAEEINQLSRRLFEEMSKFRTVGDEASVTPDQGEEPRDSGSAQVPSVAHEGGAQGKAEAGEEPDRIGHIGASSGLLSNSLRERVMVRNAQPPTTQEVEAVDPKEKDKVLVTV
ncbi:methyl-accepting chemotaxis protein [Paenibacillus swuensis]|uniref:methyl-accepting chemotaxis protein n=1 Tax=Paenibacillus swuensis TaxID=1178515 RepID=UPI000837C98E|nr:methyl-accepting chemotaxis protein [Paenibacillus swuensis]